MNSIAEVGMPHPWPGHVNRMTTPLIKEKDTDSDRMLSAEELGAPENVFDRIDKNDDGQADRVELNAFYPKAQFYESVGPLQPDNNEENSNVDLVV